MNETRIRVFLVDDHEVVRRGVRDLLTTDGDIEVIGESSSVAETLAKIGPLRPDVAVIDVRLPDGNGVELCREVRSMCPSTACLMLTSFTDDEAMVDAIVAGAAGYVLKQIRGNDLLNAVRTVAAGGSLLDPSMAAAVFDRLRRPEVVDERLERLTDQERKILELIAEGHTNRQIGQQLYLAEKTVKNYVSNLLAKLGMQRRTEAAVFATKLRMERQRSAG
jgi:two-component system response regulator DevR